MKKYVKLAIEIDKENKKHCDSQQCPWFEQHSENCSAFENGGENLKFDPELDLYKRSSKCLRMEVKPVISKRR